VADPQGTGTPSTGNPQGGAHFGSRAPEVLAAVGTAPPEQLRVAQESRRLAEGMRQIGSPDLRAHCAREAAALLIAADETSLQIGLRALHGAAGRVPGPDEFHSMVTPLLRHASPAVRAFALDALRATVADPQDAPWVLALASDPSVEVRQRVVAALRFSTGGDLSSPQFAGAVEGLLSDEAESVRLWSVRDLRACVLPDSTVDRVLSLAEDPKFRDAALGGPLASLTEKPRAVVDALLAWLEGSDVQAHAKTVSVLRSGIPADRHRQLADAFLRLAARRTYNPSPVEAIAFVEEFGDSSHLEGLARLAAREDLPVSARSRASEAQDAIRKRASR
jgi:hypothetical protein